MENKVFNIDDIVAPLRKEIMELREALDNEIWKNRPYSVELEPKVIGLSRDQENIAVLRILASAGCMLGKYDMHCVGAYVDNYGCRSTINYYVSKDMLDDQAFNSRDKAIDFVCSELAKNMKEQYRKKWGKELCLLS